MLRLYGLRPGICIRQYCNGTGTLQRKVTFWSGSTVASLGVTSISMAQEPVKKKRQAKFTSQILETVLIHFKYIRKKLIRKVFLDKCFTNQNYLDVYIIYRVSHLFVRITHYSELFKWNTLYII